MKFLYSEEVHDAIHRLSELTPRIAPLHGGIPMGGEDIVATDVISKGEDTVCDFDDEPGHVEPMIIQPNVGKPTVRRMRDADFEKIVESLYPTQRLAYDIVSRHAYSLGAENQPFFLFVSGEGGTGKSELIKALVQCLLRAPGAMGSANPVVHLAAPTGSAAVNIGSNTLHGVLGFSVDLKQPLTPERRHQLVLQWKDCRYLIIDEISMVGDSLFGAAITRIQELLELVDVGSRVSIITLGDFFQLKPVMAKFVFKHKFWRENFVFIELDKNWRCKQDARYTALLQRIRAGVLTNADKELLKTRLVSESEIETLVSRGVPTYCCTHEQCDRINSLHLKKACVSDANGDVVEAIDVVVNSKKANTPDPRHEHIKESRDGRNLLISFPTFLNVPSGAKVMLTSTIDIDDGLVNGTTGTIVGREHLSNGQVAVLHFLPNDPMIGKNAKLASGGAPFVRIERRAISFVGKRGLSCSRE